MRGRVEVVGAGIAGLTSASLLARAGWSVRIHERADPIQRVGAAIFLKENGLRVLDVLGVSAPVMAAGQMLRGIVMHGDGGRLLVRRSPPGEDRTVCAPRAVLQEALLVAARESGVELVEGSNVERALPDGTVVRSGGVALPAADLVLGADGIRSAVRDNGAFGARFRTLGESSYRFVIRGDGEEPWTVEHWAGTMRVGVAPCGPDDTYVFLCAPVAGDSPLREPLPVERWIAAFPHLRGLMERLVDVKPVYASHANVVCRRWISGRVALIGDAACGQPPNLGQGAGLAISNAAALVHTLAHASDVPSALADWERARSEVARRTQRWSTAYTQVACRWPGSLVGLRSELLRGLANWGPTAKYWSTLARAEARGGDARVDGDLRPVGSLEGGLR